MALKLKYVKKVYGTEIQFNESYHQITHIQGDKNKISIDTTIYDDSNKQNVIEQVNYILTPLVTDDSLNFIKQGYEYLKTRPEYVDAIDC